MTVERLLLAYRSGLYYWHHPLKPVKWWSPDPRIVLDPNGHYPSATPEEESIRSTVNTDFERLLRLCQRHFNGESAMTAAWLPERMVRIFIDLDKQGHVHAQEIWKEDELCGGFFGVCLGQLCFGEYTAGASEEIRRIAVVEACRALGKKGVRLMDMHKETARSDQLEYDTMSRVAFVDLCRQAAGP